MAHVPLALSPQLRLPQPLQTRRTRATLGSPTRCLPRSLMDRAALMRAGPPTPFYPARATGG